MSSDRDARVDILDLLINLLKEHEQKMDELTYRLETLIDERKPTAGPPREASETIGGVVARVSSWGEFKRQSASAVMLALGIDERTFKVTALRRGIFIVYQEEIPVLEVIRKDESTDTTYAVTEASLTMKSLLGSLECGLELDRRVIDSTLPEGGSVQRVVHYVDPGKGKSWLADQLDVEESSIILGELSLWEDQSA